MTPETTATRPPQLAVLPDPSGLLCGIMENPEDDVRRLIYADWLDEQGEGDRAELIRAQIALFRGGLPGKGGVRPGEWSRLRARVKALTQARRTVLAGLGFSRYDFVFERGFVARVDCPWDRWVQGGDLLRATEWVPNVVLATAPLFPDDDIDHTSGEFVVAGQTVRLPPDLIGTGEAALCEARWPGTAFEVVPT